MIRAESNLLLGSIAAAWPNSARNYTDEGVKDMWAAVMAEVDAGIAATVLRNIVTGQSGLDLEFPPSLPTFLKLCMASGGSDADAVWDCHVGPMLSSGRFHPSRPILEAGEFPNHLAYVAARNVGYRMQGRDEVTARKMYLAEYRRLQADPKLAETRGLPDMTASAEIAEHGGQRDAPPAAQSIANARAHVKRAPDNPAPTAPDPANPTKPGRVFGYRTAADDRQEPGRLPKPINLDEWRQRTDGQEGTGTD